MIATEPVDVRPRGDAGDDAGPRPGAAGIFLGSLWFGLVAGWLDLGLVRLQDVVRPVVTTDLLRTNRHAAWMVPVSVAAIFGVAGLALALLAWLRPTTARRAAWRLPAGLATLALLLDVRGLHPAAAAVLACGVGMRVGSWLDRRAAGFGRLVRWSLPALAVALAAWVGFSQERVLSAERRAIEALPPARPGAPNVLLVVLDTVRASCLSLYGHDRPTSPALELRARHGVVFNGARSPAPWTAPSHASLFTGRWPHELSVAPGVPLDGAFPTLAEELGRAGYATAGFVGNVYYCNARYGLGRGFARYEDAYENRAVTPREIAWSTGLGRLALRLLGVPMRLDDPAASPRKTAAMLNRDLLDWLGRRPAGRPFFAFVNYYDAHRPYVFHDDPAPRFGLATLPADAQRAIDRRLVDLAAGRPAPEDVDPRQAGDEAIRLYHDSYDSCIAYLDRQLGLLLDEMECRGLLENTLVIVTADHGEQLGEHGLITHGASLYDAEVRVPLVVIPPVRPSAAVVVDEPVSLRAVPATIADWAGLGARSPFPGRSLARFLADGPGRHSRPSRVLSELQHNVAFEEGLPLPVSFRPLRSLAAGDHVYIRGDDGREELYDLRSDPLQLRDLAADPLCRDIVEDLRAQLLRLSPPPTTPGPRLASARGPGYDGDR